MADQDVVYMPIRRATILRLATRAPPSAVRDLFASDPRWYELGSSLTFTAESLVASPEPSSYTPSPSASSSPMFFESSSRANSLARSELPPSADELPVPMDVGLELEALRSSSTLFESSSGATSLAPSEFSPSEFSSSDNDELPVPELEPLRLRGGWLCPRAGGRIPLARETLRRETYAGLPMIEGPSGPEPEEEDYGRELMGIGDREETTGGGDRGEEEDEGEPEVDALEEDEHMGIRDSAVGDREETTGGGDRGEEEDEEEDEGEPEVDVLEEDEHAVALPKKRKRRNNDPNEWVKVVRKKRTRKEAISLIAAISAISTQRHQGDLMDLINHISNNPDPHPETHPTGSSPPHILFTLARQYDLIALDAKVFDFRRMVLLMQIAICVDWQAKLRPCTAPAILTQPVGKCVLTRMAIARHL